VAPALLACIRAAPTLSTFRHQRRGGPGRAGDEPQAGQGRRRGCQSSSSLPSTTGPPSSGAAPAQRVRPEVPTEGTVASRRR
jgi:hypothetical protein